MRIDPINLRIVFDKFISTPQGKDWLDCIGLPGWLLLCVSALQTFVGWLLLFTIVFLPRGIQWIASGITFRPYRTGLRKQIHQDLDTLQIIPACGIIIGPSGAGLVLGSYSSIELDELAELANLWGELYSYGSERQEESELLKLLRDDVYQDKRRRAVPAVNARGHELYLFDTHVQMDEVSGRAGAVTMVLATTLDPSGAHVQLPWKPFIREVECDVAARKNKSNVLPLDEAKPEFDWDYARPAENALARPEQDRSQTEFVAIDEPDEVDEVTDDEVFPIGSESSSNKRNSKPQWNPPQDRAGHEGNEVRRNPAFLKQAGYAAAIITLALMAGYFFPTTIAWLTVSYLLVAIGLLIRAWVLPFRHAMKHDKVAAVFFVLPWYFVKYSIRNWPETRNGVLATGLFVVWIAAPVIIALPLNMIASLVPDREFAWLNEPDSNNPELANHQPTQQFGLSESQPKNPNAMPTSMHQRNDPDGIRTMTITWSDGTTGEWKRPSLKSEQPDVTRMQELSKEYRRQSELESKLVKAPIGSVLVAELRGIDLGFIHGGENRIYSIRSSVGSAAVHAGLVKFDKCARVKLTIVPCPALFPMLEQNGLISVASGSGIDTTAYQIELAQEADVSTILQTEAESSRPAQSRGFQSLEQHDKSTSNPVDSSK